MVIYGPDNNPFVSVDVDDTSNRYRRLMSEDRLVLEFSLAEHVELPVGAWCLFEAQKYVLMALSAVTVHHRRNYEYTVTMEGPMAETENCIIHNPVDHRIKFDLTAKPIEHMRMIVANLNERAGSALWSVGSCIDAEAKTVSYSLTNCRNGIIQVANTFETEFEFIGYTINLGKVEYHKSTPLALSYGKNNGLTPGLKRVASSMPVGRVFIQGGERNISLAEYGASTLHLPKGVTFRFDGEDFVDSGGVQMATDAEGFSVSVVGTALNATELGLDLSHIYPSRVGAVSAVRFLYKKGYYTYSELVAAFPNLTDEDWDEVQVDIIDSSIPESLDYDECLLTNNQPLTVIFQSGELAGREFNATFFKDEKVNTYGPQTTVPGNRFELVKADHDGVSMPTRNFLPSESGNGDKYAVFNCYLPDAYINDPSTKTGAEWDALRAAAKFLYENMDAKVTYRGDLDGIVAKKDWVNIGDYLKCGSYVSFSDVAVQPTAIPVRIIGVKQYVNDPYKPAIELSNELVSMTKASEINKLQNESAAHVEALSSDVKRYASRSFRSAKETAQMLVDAGLSGFSQMITPISVQTMQMIAGDERLQFRFITSMSNATPAPDPVQPFDTETKTLTISHAYLQHLTLGINSITPAGGRPLSDYKIWELQEHTSAVLSDPKKRYYIYAKVSKTTTAGEFLLNENSIGIEDVEGYYHLLIGVLNSEDDGDRSYARLYGFTEVLPGQVTTELIRSSDGKVFIDLASRAVNLDNILTFSVVNGQGRVVLNGAFVQTGSGDVTVLGAWCGEHDMNRIYKLGDEVWKAVDGVVSTYRYVNSVSSRGHDVTDTDYWIPSAVGKKGDDGDPGDSVEAQFSADGSTWHNTYTSGDKYMRTRIGSGSSWSDAIPIVGEDGSTVYVSFVFKQSDTQPATPTGTNPIPSGWSDAPPTGGHRLKPISDNSSIKGRVSFSAPAGSTVDIVFRASSEANYDIGYLGNLDDNNVSTSNYKAKVSGTQQTTVSFTNVSAGSHYFDVMYVKDSSQSSNDDTVYIDSIKIRSTGEDVDASYDSYFEQTGSVWFSKSTVTDGVSDGNWSTPRRLTGENGIGIVSAVVEYNTSSSGSVAPVGGWSTAIQVAQPGQYLWTRTTITYSSGATSVAYSVSRQGENGSVGDIPVGTYVGEYDPEKVYYGTSVRTDIIHHNATNMYYIAKPSAGIFSGKSPTNTAYWNEYGASFDSIATGLAFIQNLIVQRLNTAGDGVTTKRIVAEGNVLTMYDDSNNVRLMISGDDLSDAGTSSDPTLSAETVLASGTKYNPDFAQGFHDEDESNGKTVNVDAGAVLTLPSLRVYVNAAANGLSGGSVTLAFRAYWVIDDREVSTGVCVGELSSSSFSDYIDIGSVKMSVGAGYHRVAVKVMLDGGSSSGVSATSWSYSASHNASSFNISYSTQKTEIAANGFQVMFGSNQMLRCKKSGNSILFLMQADDYGIEVTPNGLWVRLNGTWYSCSRNSSGVLALTSGTPS